jgi:glycosyltransferase involved in cell wall biosynthesis
MVIAYYWPPSGGGGVQRWVRLVRHLRAAGVEPTVVRPRDADYPMRDESLRGMLPEDLREIAVPIFEPYRAFRRLTGKGSKTLAAGFVTKEKPGAAVRLLAYLRGNFMIPDARKYWVGPVVRALKGPIERGEYDVMITTGPPQSVHLIGRALKRKTGLKWVADFRDFWTAMDHEDLFKPGRRARALQDALERSVVAEADEVVCTAPGLGRAYSAMRHKPALCITNGFDEEDFEGSVGPDGARFTVGHYGTLGADRFSPVFWEVLAELAVENEAFGRALRIELFGPTDAGTLEKVASAGLDDRAVHRLSVSHEEAVKAMCGASVLMVALNQNRSEKGRLPGKIFEYLASGRPVVGLGDPDSDLGELIRETGAGLMADRGDAAAIRQFVLDVWEARVTRGARPEVIVRFTGRQLAARYAEVLKSLME